MQSTSTPRASRVLPMILSALRQHALLIAVVVIYAVIANTLAHVYPSVDGTDKLSALVERFLHMLPGMAYFLLLGRYLYIRRVFSPAKPMIWLKEDVRRVLTDPDRLISGLLAVLLMMMVLISFAQLKRLIPVLQPFAWDTTFIAVDRALHFGTDPWRIAHGLAGHPLMITLATGAYNLWLFMMYFVLLATCFHTGNRDLRMQYLIAFILTWAIGGNLLATLFSSAGPVYVARLGLGETFTPLMAILQAHAESQPISVVETQDLLWSIYQDPNSLNSISAFPSMHVASTVLMAVYGFRLNRWLGWALTVFAGLIMLGSVMLAWHYAVDGYAGALVALGSWALAGVLTRRFARPAEPATT